MHSAQPARPPSLAVVVRNTNFDSVLAVGALDFDVCIYLSVTQSAGLRIGMSIESGIQWNAGVCISLGL